jgi:uncharacterized protein (DUF1330 family)
MTKILSTAALSMLAGVAIGSTAVLTLHAQAKPPAYVITEGDVTNVDAYIKEYVPLVRKAFLDGGAKYLATNGKVVTFAGEPPKRIAILVFDNLDKAQAALTSAAFKNARAIGEKYAQFRTFAAEGDAPSR